MKRRLCWLMLVFGLVLGTAAPAGAVADNVAYVVNSQDGSYRWREAVKVTYVAGDTVDQVNLAWAQGDGCQVAGCRTTAVAMQVVLAFGDPSLVGPQNLAVALNTECDHCQTVAWAIQVVATTDGPVHFSPGGNAALASVRARLNEVLVSDPSLDILASRLQDLTEELKDIVDGELRAAGRAGTVTARIVSDRG